MSSLNSARVTVHKDEYGFYPAGETRRLDCEGVQFIENDDLNLSALHVDPCATVIPDGASVTAGANTVPTAKIKIPTKGFIWIARADYDTLIDACSACCIT